MTVMIHRVIAILLVFCLLMSSTIAAPWKEKKARTLGNRDLEPKGDNMLRAHRTEGAQPRFAEYPLLYFQGFRDRRR